MNSNLLRGSLETIIIKMLSDHNEMYGYEMTKMVKEQSEGHVNITEGALYPKLHKLEADGIIVSESRSIGNRYRKYYKLTEKGQQEKVRIMDEMSHYLNSMLNLLQIKPT